MKQLGWLLRGFVISVVLGLSAAAGWAAWEAGSSPVSHGMLSGKIASVDPLRNVLRVKTGLFKHTDFVIRDSTKISNGASDLTVADLRPGDKVNIAYRESAGERIIGAMTVNSDAIPVLPEPPLSRPEQPEAAQPIQPPALPEASRPLPPPDAAQPAPQPGEMQPTPEPVQPQEGSSTLQ